MNNKNAKPLYEQIYEDIRSDILSGRMKKDERLPSKRELSERLSVSVITVENAYSQLIAEGYVRAAERSGYFVQYSGEPVKLPENAPEPVYEPEPESFSDVGTEIFPFSVWTRLMRTVILEKGSALLKPTPSGGAMELRAAISGYLYRARGICQPPERIIIGAGSEYFYDMLIRLLGRDKRFGIEDPGFYKLSKIYKLGGANFEYISLDESGMKAHELYEKNIDAAHISPAHHFPTGVVMPISRRREIMSWAEAGERFIIEDDYDSEFRWSGRPVRAMFSSDGSGRVIYVNTFSKTIAPSVRISYMCLSEELYEKWRETLGFYACPVPSFEQYTLARFISDGYFERHINRAKKRFRRIREQVLGFISEFPDVKIFEENAGLHFIIEADNAEQIVSKCLEHGVRVTPLKNYYSDPSKCEVNKYVVNYSAANENEFGIIK